MLTKGSGVAAQVGANGDKPGERGLSLRFGPGRVDYHDVTELIMLIPGQLPVPWEVQRRPRERTALEWRVVCVGKSKILLVEDVVRGAAPASGRSSNFRSRCPRQIARRNT